jgi:hypothetical protein
MMMRMGSPTDVLWCSLLNSPDLEYYLGENQRLLGEGYKFLTKWLEEQQIPFRTSNAGHFLLADFSRSVAKVVAEGETGKGGGITTDQEVELLNRLVDGGVYLGPGEFFSSMIYT